MIAAEAECIKSLHTFAYVGDSCGDHDECVQAIFDYFF